MASKRDWDDVARAQGGPALASVDEDESVSYSVLQLAHELDEIPLAVVGIVPCKVSTENGPVRVGDLLVTASTPGHAMRDENPQVGTVLGKALQSLETGTGVIEVLVTLQ